MNELSEFFKTVSIEKTRVAEERKRFEPRIEIKETDLSDFFGTIKTGQQNQIVLAQREGTKLNALQTFFTRLQTFENSLQEQIEKQKEDDNWEDTESYEIEQLKKEKTESEKKQEELEPIVETKQEERFPTAEERWPRAGETIKEIKQVEVNK